MADDSEQVGQDEIEQLLRQAQSAGGAATPTPPEAKEEPPQEPDVGLDQGEIEKLLGQGSEEAAPVAAVSTASSATAAPPQATAEGESVAQDDIALLLDKAQEALASVDAPSGSEALMAGIESFQFEDLGGSTANTESATLELMRDVQLDLTIELGRTHMHLQDVLKLKQGTVVPLDKLAGDPADIFVNGRLVARGEVLVLNDNFCVRVAELIVGESACA